MTEETYIGDGVYVSPSYGGVMLRTQRLEGNHWIVLGPNEWAHLVEYVKRLEAEPPKPTEEG